MDKIDSHCGIPCGTRRCGKISLANGDARFFVQSVLKLGMIWMKVNLKPNPALCVGGGEESESEKSETMWRPKDLKMGTFLQMMRVHVSGSEKKGLLEKGSFQKNPFSRDSRELEIQ